MSHYLFFISLLWIFVACQGALPEQGPQESTLKINHYRQDCQGEGPMKCMLVQEGKQIGTDQWELFYDQIEGFNYEEGYVYTLKIKKEKVENPPADASSLKYTLVKLVSKEKAR